MEGNSVVILGVETARKYIEKQGKIIEAVVKAQMRDISVLMTGKVKEDIASMPWQRKDGSVGPSVDTGRFLNSVKGTSGMEEGSGWARIESNVEYAQFLEYGTSRMAPRGHFHRVLWQNENEIKDILAGKLKSNLG